MADSQNHSRGQLLIAAMFCCIAAVVAFVVPQQYESGGIMHLRMQAISIGRVLSESFGDALVKPDSVVTARLENSVRTLDELRFVATVSDSGELISVVIPYASDSSRTAEMVYSPANYQKSVIVETVPINHQSAGSGSLVLGISSTSLMEDVAVVRKLSYAFGLFVFLLATTFAVSIVRSKAFKTRLSLEKGELSQELERLKGADERLQQLRAATLRTARITAENGEPTNLDEAGDETESVHSDLLYEKAERKRVEAALDGSSRRLQAMNDIAVSALRSINQEAIVTTALNHLNDIIDYDFARVVEFDQWKGEGKILGSRMDEDLKPLDFTQMPITYFRAGDNVDRYQRYAPDLSQIPSPADLESDFLEAGLHSFFRQSLKIGEEVIGVMTIASRGRDAFSSEDMKAGRDIVDMIALAISVNRYNSERDRYEAELIAAKDRAEEMARLKTAFLSNMSHEIRTPLGGIIGFAQVMEEELEGEMQEFAGLIYKGGQRLMDTINSVLDFAKLEAGQLSMVATPTNVNEAVRETVKMLKPLANQKDLQLQLSLSDEMILCTLDRSGLERIITNLVGNAIKFTEDGYVEISTEIEGEFGRMIVSDTGIGISEEFMPDLFNEFYQADMGSERAHEGSGLGLAITRRLVDKMGGWIEVDNREVRGTIFTITFPLSSNETSEDRDEDIHSVLVVSGRDEMSYSDYARLQHELDLQTAPDLKAAVQHARHRRFDLVVVQMQGLDPETEMMNVRAVRDIPEYDTVPIVAFSDTSTSAADEAYLQREFDGVNLDPEGITAYLLRIAIRNREKKRNIGDDEKADDELDQKWADDDPYGDGYDSSHLFEDEGQKFLNSDEFLSD